MRRVLIEIPDINYRAVEDHLLGRQSKLEQAAFVFAHARATQDLITFQYVDWWLIQPGQFAIQQEYHLELDDGTRAKVIKKAHDLGCSLIEFHSHPDAEYAAFSPSDFWGLSQFVPHVWWRLAHRPYAAVVVSPSSLDGLAWIESPERPELLEQVETGGRALHSTGISMRQLREKHGDSIR